MQRSNEIINNVDEEAKDDDGVGLLCRLRKRAPFGKESLLAPPSLPPRAPSRSLSPRVGNRMHAKPRGGRASGEVSERSTKWK